MKYINGEVRGQITFLPDSIEEMVEKDNPVRVIDAFVGSLDMSEFTHGKLSNTGRPPYNPRDLLKLYIYGYLNKIRSSRSLMKECKRNTEVFFLLNRLCPDFRTIADFRKDNSKAIKGVFQDFVKLCMKLSLYEKQLLAVDGTKIRAVNSKKNYYNKNNLTRKIKHIDEKLNKYLYDLDKNDTLESDNREFTTEEISTFINELKTRKSKYISYLNELKETGETQMLTTDPECRNMHHAKDGFHPSYNVQTAVDNGSHLVADYKVTNHCNDQGLLKEVTDGARENLEIETIEAVGDKGYESSEDILNCVMSGIVPQVDSKFDKNDRLYTIEHIDEDITDEIKESTKPKNIQKCLHAGILPKCYENTAIQVEVQHQNQISCFERIDEETVICPMGEILTKSAIKSKGIIYQNRLACRNCENRCTASRKYKQVLFGHQTTYVPVKMFGNPSYPLKTYPQDLPLPNNFYRKDDITSKVVIRIKLDRKRYKLRMCLSEHPFGTVKRYHGSYYVLCKGIEKVTAEMGLSFLAYNMTRAINMVGVEKLIEASRG